jgi:hypothetical protein
LVFKRLTKTQTLRIDGVQSEKNKNVGRGVADVTKSQPDYSNPDSPCATLPCGDYTATKTGGTPNHADASIITSNSISLPGFSTKGISSSWGFLIHAYSDKNATRTLGWSLGCQVLPDKGFDSYNSTLESYGIKNGDSYPLKIR